MLVSAADALITLTPGAAAEIRRRWGREAWVLPHPHVVEEPILSRPRPGHDGFVIGVHVKSLRANMDPLPVIEGIVEVLAQMPGARLRVDAHTDVMTPVFLRYAPELAAGLRTLEDGRGLIDLHVHDYFTDDELWDYLPCLDVSVLPYRFGTPLRLARGLLRPRHDRARAGLRLLRRAAAVRDVCRAGAGPP